MLLNAQKICDKYLETDYCRQLSAVPAIDSQSMDTLDANNNNNNGIDGSAGGGSYRVGYWRQLRALSWRSWLVFTRHPDFSQSSFVRTLVSNIKQSYNSQVHLLHCARFATKFMLSDILYDSFKHT